MTSPYVTETLPDGRTLVFGLAWNVVIGNDLDRLARRSARRAKASHYVRGGPRSHIVGTVRLKGRDAAGSALHSPAAAIARAMPTGTRAVRVRWEDGRVWVGAAHNGAVLMGGDRIYASDFEADAAVAALHDMHPDLQAYGDGTAQPLPAGVITDHLTADTTLQPSKLTLAAVPVGLRWLLAGAAALALLNAGWTTWRDHQQQQERAAREASRPDDAQLWRDAVAAWQAGTVVDGQPGLSSLYDALLSIPLALGRWPLHSATCTPATASQWSCEARFRRGPLGTHADAVAAAPPGWDLDVSNLALVEARWTARRVTTTLAATGTPSWGWTSWQQLLPALEGVATREAQPAAIQPAPTWLPDGTQYQPPPAHQSGVKLPRTRNFDVTGPLRSFSLAPIWPQARISKVQLHVLDEATPTLQRSALTATLTGTIYETD
ncbi:hypothetical protein IMZ29_06970 [Achromobacter sp. GG226]|uniref:hypothetical protein n=1 Tax=Verticiella alkaliphila TaxID=2779529 RepID=UPI001C0B44E4|nr:hypothetical protein [Verticiella sp. GG226]MBU4610288.1 hypothetical protein [Verticiella sp. GG226]